MTVFSIDLETATLNRNSCELLQTKFELNFFKTNYVQLKNKCQQYIDNEIIAEKKYEEHQYVIESIKELFQKELNCSYSGDICYDLEQFDCKIDQYKNCAHQNKYNSEMYLQKIDILEQQCMRLQNENESFVSQINQFQTHQTWMENEMECNVKELESLKQMEIDREIEYEVLSPTTSTQNEGEIITLCVAVQTDEIDSDDPTDISELIIEMQNEIDAQHEKNKKQFKCINIQTDLLANDVFTINELDLMNKEYESQKLEMDVLRTPNMCNQSLELELPNQNFSFGDENATDHMRENDNCVENISETSNVTKETKDKCTKKEKRKMFEFGHALFTRTQKRIQKRQEYNLMIRRKIKANEQKIKKTMKISRTSTLNPYKCTKQKIK